MRFKNSTDFSDAFLRRMTSWCARQVGLPVRKIRYASFKKAKRAFSGVARSRSFTVRIGNACWFPTSEYYRFGVKHCAFRDRVEALVGVTAHELYHCWQYEHGKISGSRHNEPAAMQAQREATKAFAANREALMAEWSKEPVLMAADKSPKPSLLERRAAKALADLERWQRRLKLAQTKVKKAKLRVRYYQKRQEASQEARTGASQEGPQEER